MRGPGVSSLRDVAQRAQRHLLMATFEACAWNTPATAAALRMTRQSLLQVCSRLGVSITAGQEGALPVRADRVVAVDRPTVAYLTDQFEDGVLTSDQFTIAERRAVHQRLLDQALVRVRRATPACRAREVA